MNEEINHSKYISHPQQNDQPHHYQHTKKLLLQFISDANPIQNRQKLKPSSLFPIYQLPKFKFSHEPHIPTTSTDITHQREILSLESQSLKDIFQQPIYQYNTRVSIKNNNQFGCIRIDLDQFRYHPFIKNPQTIQEYLQQHTNKKIMYSQGKSQKILSTHQNPTQFPNQQLKYPITTVLTPKTHLYFDSRFQSGNLCFATPVPGQQQAYYLLCSRDINTTKYTQWFFFKTINTQPGKVTFHILNFVKSYSIFENGMKICYASKTNNYQWLRGCEDIKYRKTNLPITNKNSQKYYYALSFSYTYTSPQDNVYFAYCYPYTYTMLEQFLYTKSDPNPHTNRRRITPTLGGNNIQLVTITNFKTRSKKKLILITSRVHPGQTPSSFICEGMMKFLMGNSIQAEQLRQHFVFKFIPMLNPDGVINGSYRCNLSGEDLNRVWDKATKLDHPQIYQTCKLIYQLNQKQKIFLFIDLHAHSKKKGIFAYGCQNKNNPYICRQLPYLFAKNIMNFNYHQCNFSMKVTREGTSRMFFYQNFDIDYSYTFQHSFCGPLKQKIHYIAKDYCKLGIEYLLTLHKYYLNYIPSSQQQYNAIFAQLYTNKQYLKHDLPTDNDNLSSSDEELDHTKINSKKNATKQQKYQFKKYALRISQKTLIKDNKISHEQQSNLNRKSTPQLQITKQLKDDPIKKQQPSFSTLKKIPIVQLSLLQKKIKISKRYQKNTHYLTHLRHRKCFSSFNTYNNSYLKQKSTQNKFNSITTIQQQQQQQQQIHKQQQHNDQIQKLNSIFLPSLTKGSYQKYTRKNQYTKEGLLFSNNFIDNIKLLKQEIKAVKKKKKIKRSPEKFL